MLIMFFKPVNNWPIFSKTKIITDFCLTNYIKLTISFLHYKYNDIDCYFKNQGMYFIDLLQMELLQVDLRFFSKLASLPNPLHQMFLGLSGRVHRLGATDRLGVDCRVVLTKCLSNILATYHVKGTKCIFWQP